MQKEYNLQVEQLVWHPNHNFLNWKSDVEYKSHCQRVFDFTFHTQVECK